MHGGRRPIGRGYYYGPHTSDRSRPAKVTIEASTHQGQATHRWTAAFHSERSAAGNLPGSGRLSPRGFVSPPNDPRPATPVPPPPPGPDPLGAFVCPNVSPAPRGMPPGGGSPHSPTPLTRGLSFTRWAAGRHTTNRPTEAGRSHRPIALVPRHQTPVLRLNRESLFTPIPLPDQAGGGHDRMRVSESPNEAWARTPPAHR